MPALDFETIRFLALVMMVLAAITMTITWRINKTMAGPGLWALATGVGVLAFLVVPFAPIIGALAVRILTNLLFLASLILLLDGVIRFHGYQSSATNWLRNVLGAGLVLHGLIHRPGDVSFTIVQESASIALLIAGAAVLVWGRRGIERLVYGLLALASTVLAVLVAVFTLRVLKVGSVGDAAGHWSRPVLYICIIAWSMVWSWGLVAAANIRNQREIRALANRDPLTGLSNRRSLEVTFQRATLRARRSRTFLGIVVIDLDGFKAINDRDGHGVGDLVLAEFAARLRRVVRGTDLAVRLGGDEFLVLLENLPDSLGLARAVARLRISIDGKLSIGERRIDLGFSMGGAMQPDDGSTLDALLEAADRRMYAEKSARRAA